MSAGLSGFAIYGQACVFELMKATGLGEDAATSVYREWLAGRHLHSSLAWADFLAACEATVARVRHV